MKFETLWLLQPQGFFVHESPIEIIHEIIWFNDYGPTRLVGYNCGFKRKVFRPEYEPTRLYAKLNKCQR